MFFYTVFVIFVLVHSFLFWNLLRAFGRGWWQLPVVLWFCCMLGVWCFRHVEGGVWTNIIITVGFVWLGFSLIAALCLFIAGLLRYAMGLAASFMAWRRRKKGEEPRENSDDSSCDKKIIKMALIIAACISVYSLWEAQNIQPYYITVPTQKLPAGTKRLRIAVVSDVHLSRTIGPAMLSRIVKIVNDAQPDMFISLGDLVDTDMTQRSEDAALLRSIKTRYGSYGVLGNHEFYRGIENSLSFHKAAGIDVLRGEATKVGGICLVGVDDPLAKNHDLHTNNPMPALLACPQEDFVLFLNHRPKATSKSLGLFDLQLSGHLHGGQIWPADLFFRFFIHKTSSHFSYRTAKGKKPGLTFITYGTGFWGPPMRFLTPPEVVILDLVAQE